MSYEDIGISGIFLIVTMFFFFVGFVKGLAKTLMALFTLSATGFSAWWCYHHGPSHIAKYVGELPDYMDIVSSVTGGLFVFFLLYKLFHFIVNPFESDDDDKKKKWNFGFPAALISLLFALCFVYFVVNRLRTTDELNKLSELMEKGISEKTNDTGIGSFIIEKISANPIGSFIFNNDPLWNSERGKLTELMILNHDNTLSDLPQQEAIQKILQNPDFKKLVTDNKDILDALDSNDCSALWNSEAVQTALNNKEIVKLLKDFVPPSTK